MLDKIGRVGDSIVSIVSGLLAAVLILYSGYVIWDSFYTQRSAFSSWELMQFRPNVEEGEEPSFTDLIAVNPDVRGWLTIYGTNIDYPLLQGKDDLDYINKDVYGKFSLSGSIYLATDNASDFTDDYNLVYGHHMDNGAMFGDIDQFTDKSFFQNNRTGILITSGQVYDLNIFACVETDAYEALIYNAGGITGDDFPRLLNFIEEHALQQIPMDASDLHKLVALSTCADGLTNGRTVLFADMTPRQLPLPETGKTETQKAAPEVQGHGDGGYWAVMNLICLILTAYLFLPLHLLREKYVRLRTKKVLIAGILEALIVLVAICLFLRTENIHNPLTLVDWFTPVMIGLLAVSWLVDVRLVRRK